MTEEIIQNEEVKAQDKPEKKRAPRRERANREERPADEFIDRVVHVNRVSKTVKGGRNMSFAALVVVGDKKGRIGFAHAKAKEVPDAIKKATDLARRKIVRVPLKEGRTLHHDIYGHFGAGKVTLRTAPAGTGIIAGGPMRAVFEVLGVQDVVAKCTGSNNPHNMVRATFKALLDEHAPRNVAARRGKKVGEIVGNREATVADNAE
ncbi:MAG: 30S ribosomal protein S5 [Alphaproteobacteria bacterium]